VVGFSETLRVEAAQHGIKVSVVCPGFVSSGIFVSSRQCTQREDMTHEEAARMAAERLQKLGRTPEKVAQGVLQVVQKNRGVMVIFAEARLGDFVHRLSRRASDILAIRAFVMGRKGMQQGGQ
jgi:short-subunit dehydrogenase